MTELLRLSVRIATDAILTQKGQEVFFDYIGPLVEDAIVDAVGRVCNEVQKGKVSGPHGKSLADFPRFGVVDDLHSTAV
jgi:hypothetical protein